MEAKCFRCGKSIDYLDSDWEEKHDVRSRQLLQLCEECWTKRNENEEERIRHG